MGFPVRIQKTAGQAVVPGSACVETVVISNLGADTVQVTLLDSADASGTQKIAFYVPPNVPTQTYPFEKEGLEFKSGVWAIVEGASPDVTIVVA